MKPFRHVSAETIEEATSILEECQGGARIIAGGTDLLGEMKDCILPDGDYPRTLINIKNIPGLDYVREDDGTLHVWLDGAHVGTASTIRVRCVPDAVVVVA